MVHIDSSKIETVVIHPTPLLAIVDHMNRALEKSSDERVIGALLGKVRNGVVDITESFGVPFKEKPDEGIWFLDIDYVDDMVSMTRKVNVFEKVVGWYQTGTKLQLNDIAINDRFKTINPDVIVVLLDPTSKGLGLPAKAFIAVEETHDDGSPTTQTFKHLEIDIGAEDCEEVGVEHILRDIGCEDVTSLAQTQSTNLSSLIGLENHLDILSKYLKDVYDGTLPIKSDILEQIQSVMYELPLLFNESVRDALVLEINDDAAVTLIAMLVNTVLALNKLINNTYQTRFAELKLIKGEIESSKVPIPADDKNTKT